ACDKVDVLAGVQGLIRLDVAVGTDEGDLKTWMRFLDLADEFYVAIETNRRGEKDQKFVLFADFDGLLPVNLVRRGVQQTAARDHTGGIREPHGIPVGIEFAGRGPTRARAAVEILETRRIQQQRL